LLQMDRANSELVLHGFPDPVRCSTRHISHSPPDKQEISRQSLDFLEFLVANLTISVDALVRLTFSLSRLDSLYSRITCFVFLPTGISSLTPNHAINSLFQAFANWLAAVRYFRSNQFRAVCQPWLILSSTEFIEYNINLAIT
jgi:hypothetical protein